ncbi:MAG: protein-export chaperone SecB [Methylococcales bacterium]|jgi:preprotein translocase subunit SecB|nr:protein-export chaperone SecB [Methylococcales bacterium]MBT7409751.1 protein-export chaperone SecB [Methylococcales bacterium]
MNDETQNKNNEKQFAIQKIYTKDMSFETPHSPQIFTEEWKPELNLNLNTETKPIQEDVIEVILSLTVTVKIGEKTAYLVEIQQAGIFTIQGFPESEIGHLLGSFCPNILFPYAREAVSDLVNKGGFPQLLLAPVNFDALYTQHLEQQKNSTQTNASTH